MKRWFNRIFAFALSAMLLAPPVKAQDDLKIYGFFQTYASSSKNSVFNRIGGSADSANVTRTTDFLMQQANILASKDLGGNFSAFVNLEFVNNYSSDKKWGFFNLQEIFAKYEYSDALKVKAGLFLPQFNNFYEIYNRMPILPYIARPFVYETAFYPILPDMSDDYLPSRSLLQVYGTAVAMEGVKVDYAVYTGSAESKFMFKEGAATDVTSPGWSSTELKNLGLRVGVRSGTLKAGVSATWDSNRFDTVNAALAKVPVANTPRQRIGIDLSYSIAGFTIAGEYLMVNHSLDDATKTQIKGYGEQLKSPQIPAAALGMTEAQKTEYVNYLTDENFMSKSFFYVSGQYDVNDKLFAYAMYNELVDKKQLVLHQPLIGYTGGLGYRPVDDVVLKGQYQYYKLDSEFFPFDVKSIYLGLSVAF